MSDTATGFFGRIAQQLWGKFESKAELRKFLLLGAIFGLIIGVYWTLRGIKDTNFGTIVGEEHIWLAKNLSLVVSIPLVLLYTWLIDTFSRYKVFYMFVTFFTIGTILFAIMFHHDTIGLANTTPAFDRYIGWAWYLFVEAFGSLIVALFWVLATDMTLPDSARRGFPMIAMVGQLGNIFGPYLALNALSVFSLPHAGMIAAGAGVALGFTGLLMMVFCKVTPPELMKGYHSSDKAGAGKHKEAGFFEGLFLLLSSWYLLGIFFIVSVYEVIITIIDNYFKVSLIGHFKRLHSLDMANKLASEFTLTYSMWVGIVALVCLLCGASNIPRKLGIRISLLMLPVLVMVAMLVIRSNAMAGSIMVMCVIMVLAKAVNYALAQPTMKQLYIPTSPDARTKAQGWIEMFGGRSSKALGAVVAGQRKAAWVIAKGKGIPGGSDLFFLTCASVFTLGLVGIWIAVAIYVSRVYNKAIKEDKVVC